MKCSGRETATNSSIDESKSEDGDAKPFWKEALFINVKLGRLGLRKVGN